MKFINTFILAIALTFASLIPTATLADPRPVGCNGYGIGTFFDTYRDANGVKRNCPPSNWETQVGNLGKALMFTGIGLAVIHKTGKPVFPLGG